MGKKITFFILLLLLTSSIWGSVFGDILGFLKNYDKKNWKANQGTLLQAVKEVAANYEELKRLKASLEIDLKNISKFNMDSDIYGKIERVEDIFNNLIKVNDDFHSIAFSNSEDMDVLWDIYFKDSKSFSNITGFTKKDLQELENITNKAQTDTNYAVYDALSNTNIVASPDNLEANKEALHELMTANKSIDGVVQGIQVTNNLLEITNQNLIEIKSIVAAQTRIAGSTSLNNDTKKAAQLKKNKLWEKEHDKILEENQKEVDKEIERWSNGNLGI